MEKLIALPITDRRKPIFSEVLLDLAVGATNSPAFFTIHFYIPQDPSAEFETSIHGAYYAYFDSSGFPWAIRMFDQEETLTIEMVNSACADLAYYVGNDLAKEFGCQMTAILRAFHSNGIRSKRFRFTDVSQFFDLYLDLYKRFANELGLKFDRRSELEDIKRYWTDTDDPGGGQAWQRYYLDPQTRKKFKTEADDFLRLMDDNVAAIEQALAT